jgi:hypothetical protein
MCHGRCNDHQERSRALLALEWPLVRCYIQHGLAGVDPLVINETLASNLCLAILSRFPLGLCSTRHIYSCRGIPWRSKGVFDLQLLLPTTPNPHRASSQGVQPSLLPPAHTPLNHSKYEDLSVLIDGKASRQAVQSRLSRSKHFFAYR